MKRKLFSAILFGALLATSTSGLTSCKDYDDDITNLQGQIDKLATKDELSTKANELANSISAAQTAANNASSAADAADKAAKAAADAAKAAQNKADEVDGKLATAVSDAAQQIQDAVKNLATKQEVADAVKEVKDKYDAQAKDLKALSDRLAKVEAKLGMGEGGEDIDLTEIQAELEDIEDAFEALVGVVSDMVTSVELVYNSQDYKYNYNNGVTPPAVCPNDLSFDIVTAEANKFGEGVADATLITEAGKTAFEPASVLVRVNPVDAEISTDEVSLINSKGEELYGIVNAIKVERYSDDKYLTRAAGTNTGLWKITYAPVEGVSSNTLAGKFKQGANKIVYAVSVKSAISDSISAERRVVSAYDVTMATKDANAYLADITAYSNATNKVGIEVNKKAIKTLKNRYGNGINGAAELIWKDVALTPSTKNTYVNVVKPGATSGTINTQVGDDRTSQSYLVAGLGESINIEFKKKIKGFYVTLDSDYAYESNPSEINAWNSYSYENVGTKTAKAHMFEGCNGTIKVSQLSGSALDDIIGFRIYAMNLDGTLVDPDGIAFYVSIGTKNADITLAPTSAYVTLASPASTANDIKNATGEIALTGEGFANSSAAPTWTCSKGDDNITPSTATRDFQVWYHNTNGTAAWSTTFNSANTYDKIRIEILKPQSFIDNATYTFKAAVNGTSNSQQYVVRNISVDVTKAMPTAVPAFRFKPQQSSDQLVTASSYAVQSSPIDGTIDINNIFVQNDGTLFDATEISKWYMWMSASTKANNNIVDLIANGLTYTNQTGVYSGTAGSVFTIKKDFIKANTVDHKLKGHYTYGQIGYKKSGANYIRYEYILPFESTDVVRYHTWSEIGEGYQTYSWKVYSQTTNNVTTTWTNDKLTIASPAAPATVGTATLNLWDIASTTGAKSAPSFDKGNLDVYVGTLKWLTFSANDVTLTVDGLDNIYYKATAVNIGNTPNGDNGTGNTITFTAQQSTDNIPAHTAELKIKVKDCFGIEQTIKLNVRFVKP